MADLLPKERLQPSLLDRLTDDEPDKKQEPRSKRILSIKRLKDCIQRDLIWLLNASSIDSVLDLSEYPHVRRSVINFGMPDLAGITVSNIDPLAMEKSLREIICHYEPRLLPKALEVKVRVQDNEMSHNSMTIEISGEMWALPIPVHLFIKTQMDLESGNIDLIGFTSDG